MVKYFSSICLLLLVSMNLQAQLELRADTMWEVKSIDLNGLVPDFSEEDWATSDYATDIRNGAEYAPSPLKYHKLKTQSNWLKNSSNFFIDFLKYRRSDKHKLKSAFDQAWGNLSIYFLDGFSTQLDGVTRYYTILIIPADDNKDWVFQASKKEPEVRIVDDLYLIFESSAVSLNRIR